MVVRINRPERRNAINRPAAEALRLAVHQFETDPAVRVLVLTGGDEAFCAGADLKEIEALDPAGPGGPLGITRTLVSKPTIAAVAGYAVGGGFELACWCDLRIADPTAIFGCFERRFGVPLFDGGTVRLPRIVGLGRALDLILTGRPVKADEALAMGLVSEVTAQGGHVERAVEIGKLIASFPPTCVVHDRRSVYEGLGKPLEEALAIEKRLGLDTLRSGETYEGARRFREGEGRAGKIGG